MYQTYKSEEIKPKKEEMLIPKEISGCEHNEVHKEIPKQLKNRSNSLFGGLDNEDILILGLLLLLYFEDCKDNMLMIVLVALLFIKD